MSACQICARVIKDNTGVIAHHGYQRRAGWQTKSCMGARELSYQKSRDVIPRAINQVENWKNATLERIEDIKQNNPPIALRFPKGMIVVSTDPSYRMRKKQHINELEWDIKSADREIERLQKRYDDWKPYNQHAGNPYADHCGHVESKQVRPDRWVTIYEAAKQGIDDADGSYAVVCQYHGTILNTDNLVDTAVHAMHHPQSFCEDCRGEANEQ